MNPDEHRQTGVELYNRTWELLEGGADADEIVDCAHASAHHWRHAAGATAANRARSNWLCAHVYAVLGRSEPSLHHAHRSLALVQAAPDLMDEFDLPSAYEALARAHAAAGDEAEARRYVELGRAEAAKIVDAEDRSTSSRNSARSSRRGSAPAAPDGSNASLRTAAGSKALQRADPGRCQLDRRPREALRPLLLDAPGRICSACPNDLSRVGRTRPGRERGRR